MENVGLIFLIIGMIVLAGVGTFLFLSPKDDDGIKLSINLYDKDGNLIETVDDSDNIFDRIKKSLGLQTTVTTPSGTSSLVEFISYDVDVTNVGQVDLKNVRLANFSHTHCLNNIS